MRIAALGQLPGLRHRLCLQPTRVAPARSSTLAPPAQQQQTPLQELFVHAKRTFAHGSEGVKEEDLDKLQSLLCAVPLEHLGVSPTERERKGFSLSRAPALDYRHVHEDSTVSLGIFSLAKGAQLPLHNHPHMTVLSRVLYGSLHITSYDFADAQANPLDAYSQPLPARPVANVTLKAENGDIAVLRPSSGGNVHAFRAVTDCAVLDVLGPPYNLSNPDRDCTYFRVHPAQQEGRVLLQACEPPRGFSVKNVPYRGQPVA